MDPAAVGAIRLLLTTVAVLVIAADCLDRPSRLLTFRQAMIRSGKIDGKARATVAMVTQPLTTTLQNSQRRVKANTNLKAHLSRIVMRTATVQSA